MHYAQILILDSQRKKTSRQAEVHNSLIEELTGKMWDAILCSKIGVDDL